MGYNKYSIDFPFKEFVYEQADAYGNVADYRSAYLWTEVKMSTAYWIPAKYVRIYGTGILPRMVQEKIRHPGKNYFR